MENHSNISVQKNEDFSILKQQYSFWMEYQGWSKRTIESYNNSIQQFIDYIQPELDWQSFVNIKPQLIYKYQHELFNRRLKSGRSIAIATMHTNLVAVRSFLNFLYLNNELHVDPKMVIKLPIKRQSLPKSILNEDQISDLLANSSGNDSLSLRNRAILELLYASGIRNSELRNLNISDVDLSQLQVMVRKGKYQKDRLIPMGEVAANWISQYLKFGRQFLFSCDSGNILFLSKTGRKITRGNLIWIVKNVTKQSGLKTLVTPHSLRHTCATHMLKNGADIRYIQELLGHASVATTQIYTRVIINDLTEVFRKTHPRAILK